MCVRCLNFNLIFDNVFLSFYTSCYAFHCAANCRLVTENHIQLASLPLRRAYVKLARSLSLSLQSQAVASALMAGRYVKVSLFLLLLRYTWAAAVKP